MDRGYIAQNDEQRARLRAIVARCTDADLTRPMPGGWTVAAVLLHAAFWDQRIAVLIERWRTTGAAPLPEDPIDVEWINDGMKPMLLAVPARKAAEMAVEIAESVDRLVAELPDEWVDRVVAANVISLVRADHRREHLDEIEDVLKR
ncbi:MAG TPA: DinB family protein [Gaiellaceae bacterium]|nr:DinB family protein [Gaiellaceae bacterium]